MNHVRGSDVRLSRRALTRCRFVMPDGPSLVLSSAHLDTWFKRIRCSMAGRWIETVNSVIGPGVAVRSSALNSATARATASKRESAWTSTACGIPSASVNETRQRDAPIRELHSRSSPYVRLDTWEPFARSRHGPSDCCCKNQQSWTTTQNVAGRVRPEPLSRAGFQRQRIELFSRT